MSERPLGVARFVDQKETLCERFGIRTVAEDGSNYLMDVRLPQALAHA